MSKVAVVTGANQGLGFSLVEALCKQLDTNACVYLTARNPARGEEAVRQLRERGYSPLYRQLDVDDDASVARLAEALHALHGGVDIVISNAAARMSPDLPQEEQTAAFINTNNHGTYRMIRAFSPILNDNARFIVVASSFGSLRNLAPGLHSRFDIKARSLEEIEQVMDEYVHLVETGRAKENAWPDWMNIPSKVAQVASMKIMALKMGEDATKRGILINAVCPGLMDTAASRPWFKDMSAAKSPAEAAGDVVWLATLPPGTKTPYGQLIQYRQVVPWL